MTHFVGGDSCAGAANNSSILSVGFVVTNVSSDGKTLTLLRTGVASGSNTWDGNLNVIEITGIK